MKAPPQKTPAFWDTVDATRAPDAELVDVLDRLGNPDAVTIITIAAEGPAASQTGFRVIAHRMERCHYVLVGNDWASCELSGGW